MKFCLLIRIRQGMMMITIIPSWFMPDDHNMHAWMHGSFISPKIITDTSIWRFCSNEQWGDSRALLPLSWVLTPLAPPDGLVLHGDTRYLSLDGTASSVNSSTTLHLHHHPPSRNSPVRSSKSSRKVLLKTCKYIFER